MRQALGHAAGWHTSCWKHAVPSLPILWNRDTVQCHVLGPPHSRGLTLSLASSSGACRAGKEAREVVGFRG